jgi:hypothetical protein
VTTTSANGSVTTTITYSDGTTEATTQPGDTVNLSSGKQKSSNG